MWAMLENKKGIDNNPKTEIPSIISVSIFLGLQAGAWVPAEQPGHWKADGSMYGLHPQSFPHHL